MELIDRLVDPDLGVTFVDLSTEDRCSFAELRVDVCRTAGRLVEHGVNPGDSVAIQLDNSRAAITALLAIWHAGATVVSMPPAPRRDAEERFVEAFGPVLRRLGVKLLIGAEATGSCLHNVVSTLVAASALVDRAAIEGIPMDLARPVPEIALVQFTSGSIGSPKGVAIRSDSLQGHLDMIATALEAGDDDIATSWLPLHHDMGLVGMLLTALWSQGPLTLMTPRSFARNPMSWLERCAATRTSITAAPNFAYRLVTFSLRNGHFNGDLSALRKCLCGAERVSARVMRDFIAAGAPFGLPSTAVLPVYGLAEATLAVSFPMLDTHLWEGTGDTVSVGTTLPGFDSRVVRVDEHGRGELELRGPWILDHYVTAAGDVSPVNAEGWYPTRDIVSVEGGRMFVHGRCDEVAIVRGRNVYAEDVESVVASVAGDRLGFHAAFRIDDAFGVAGEWLGIDDTQPDDLVADIRAAVTTVLGARLHSVRMCTPRTLPMTTSGKVKRSRCRSMVESDAWPKTSILVVG